LAHRDHFCREGLRLNRRLAASLHPDGVAITGHSDAPRVGGDGKPIEDAVTIRQFSRDDLLSRMVERRVLDATVIEGVAQTVALFHSQIRVAGADTPFGRTESVFMPLRQNFESLRSLLTDSQNLSQLARLEGWIRKNERHVGKAQDPRLYSGM
jgi:aminoglycoside phosphotransferase family enzyme